MSQHINQKIKSGLAWSFINQLIGQLLFVGFNIYLSRILGPASFGLTGMVTIFSGFASYFVDAGLGTAVIQKADISNIQVSTVFWVNVFMGLLLFLLFFFGAPAIAVFYHHAQLILLTRVISFSFIISALCVVQNALVMKQMNFKRKTIINWAAIFIAYTVAIVMARLHMGYWAIAAYLLLNPLVSGILIWLSATWRPSMQFSFKEFKKIAPFGLNVLGDSSVNYWARNADNFLIGKFLSDVDLGIYSRAYSIMMLPMKNISSVITTVMFPAFSSIQNNVATVKQYYIATIRYVALLCFPLMVGLSLVASDFTYIFFGQKWMAMAGILKWLCLLAAVQSVMSLNNIIYRSLGQAKTAFRVSIAVSAVLVISFSLGIYFGGLNGLVIAYFVVSLLLMPIVYQTALRLINTTVLEVVVQLKAPLLGIMAMGLLMFVLKRNIDFARNLAGLGAQVVSCALIYALVIWVVDKRLFTSIASHIKK